MRIIYPAELYASLAIWCRYAGTKTDSDTPTEVGWLNEVALRAGPDGSADFVIEKSWLLPHKSASSGEYSIDADAIARFKAEMRGKVNYAKLCGWDHTHPNMSVFASTTDRKNTRDNFSAFPWCVAVTHNLKGELYGEVTFFGDVVREGKPARAVLHIAERVPVLVERQAAMSEHEQRMQVLVREMVPPQIVEAIWTERWNGQQLQRYNERRILTGNGKLTDAEVLEAADLETIKVGRGSFYVANGDVWRDTDRGVMEMASKREIRDVIDKLRRSSVDDDTGGGWREWFTD